MWERFFESEIMKFLDEDQMKNHLDLLLNHPNNLVSCHLKIKSDAMISGIPFFIQVFNLLQPHIKNESLDKLRSYEGKKVKKGDEIKFMLPFNVALTGERVALNLLQHCSSITTWTHSFVELAEQKNISILDTRKTTPGLRAFEKYAVKIGGGSNHRSSLQDAFMIKDNQKNCFGSLENAVKFYRDLRQFYRPIIVEIHHLSELQEAINLNIQHVMLDNFTPVKIKEALKFKKEGMTFEVSGGVNKENISDYFIEGVDAISIGALTHSVPHLDFSLKMFPLKSDL